MEIRRYSIEPRIKKDVKYMNFYPLQKNIKTTIGYRTKRFQKNIS